MRRSPPTSSPLIRLGHEVKRSPTAWSRPWSPANMDFLRCNFPNGDMVGHTGNIEAVVRAMEYVDEGVGRIIEAGKRLGYVVLVTADHGNADQMLETKKGKTSIRTAHSLNPVPFIVVDPGVEHTLKEASSVWPTSPRPSPRCSARRRPPAGKRACCDPRGGQPRRIPFFQSIRRFSA